MDWCPYVNDMKVGSNGCQDKCVHCLGHGSDEEGTFIICKKRQEG